MVEPGGLRRPGGILFHVEIQGAMTPKRAVAGLYGLPVWPGDPDPG